MAEYPQPGGQQRSQQKFLVFDNFQKMNTQAARTGLPDNQLAWLENLQPLSENKLQVVPAVAAAAFSSIPDTINLGFYAFLNGGVGPGHDYAILFTTVGSAWFIDFTSNAIGQIAPAGTFSLAPDCTTWQGEVLLINDIKAGYCVWNTVCFVQAGGVSPNITISDGGSGWGSPGLVTFFNETQGVVVPGATGIATVVNGVNTNIQLANGGSGINPGDTIAVEIATSTGSGAVFVAHMTASSLQAVQRTSAGYFATPGAGTYALLVSAGAATATATVSPYPGFPGFFYVSSVAVGAPGSYASPPPPTIRWDTTSFPITGAGAIVPTFHAMMANVAVASVTVGAGGTSYPISSTLNLTFSPPGAAATVHTTAGGVVIAPVTVTAPGSYPFGPPAPTVSIVGGATTFGTYWCEAWPSVPAGTTLAVFQGRVWLGGGNLLQWTGTGANQGFPNAFPTPTPSGIPGNGYDDFQAIDGSGSLEIVDADLVHAITALRSLNNYLWIIGDQSVKQIGNISLTATSPPITNFTLLTLSSDQGTIWPQSCISYNRIFLFANPNGIFGVFGSTVQKVSDDLDGIFQNANFSLQPQGAVLDLNSKHNAVFLLNYNDPVAGTRALLVLFDGKKWWLANQGSNLAAILTFPQPSPNLNTLWGTISGRDLTQLFAQPGVAVPFKLQTALSHGNNPVQGKRVVRGGFTADAGSVGTINIEMDGDTTTRSNTLGVTATSLLTGGSNDASNAPITTAGIYLGVTLTGTMANLVIQNAILEYQETALWKVGMVGIAPPPPTPISSAGVFDSTGRLVRTMWSAVLNNPNVANPAAAWDGALDDGTPASSGTYTVKLLQHNVQYNWDGVAGNSSLDHTTMFYHSWFYPIQGMALTATEIYFFSQYNERWPSAQVATVADPQTAHPVVQNGFRIGLIGSVFAATDGTLAYFAFEGSSLSFIGAVSTVDGAEVLLCKKSPHTFSSGQTFAWGDSTSVCALNQTANAGIGGMAVQQSGSYLFISEPFQSPAQVLTINKTTGATLQTNTILTNPGVMATNPSDGSLWIIHGATPVIDKYTADGSGNLTASGITISGLSNPLALAVSPDGATLLVCDGGTSHQVKAFNTSDGSVKTAFGTSGAFGTAGGYINSPSVTNTKFMFHNIALGNAATFIAFGTDGSWWLGDNGNCRSLHFSSGNSPTFIEQISFRPVSYNVHKIRGDDTRILADFLEYSIDYTKSVTPNLGSWPNNGSWTLSKNWFGNLMNPAFLPDIGGYTGADQQSYIISFGVATRMMFGLVASNGRTYACTTISNAVYRVFELTNTGLRVCGVTTQNPPAGTVPLSHSYIDANFNQWFTEAKGAGQVCNIWLNQFAGFDASNDPSWLDLDHPAVPGQGQGVIKYTTQTLPAGFPNTGSATEATYEHTETTAGGIIPIYLANGVTDSTLYALGGIEPISGAVKFMTHHFPLTAGENASGNNGGTPAGNISFLQFPEAPFSAVGGGPNTGGPLHYLPGDSNIFTGMRGEDWANNQINVFSHWHDSGLLVNRFGAGVTISGPFIGAYSGPASITTLDPDGLGAQPYPIAGFPYSWKAMPGMAGQSSSGAMALVNGVYYIYQNDEWYHGGLHRWSISNTSSIQLTSQTVNWPGGIIPPNDPTNLLQGLPYNSSLVDGTAGWHRNPIADIGTTSGDWSGGNWWHVLTNVINCSRFDPDIALENTTAGVTRTLSRDLPAAGAGNWTLSGNMMCYAGIATGPPYVIEDAVYFDILDAAGKIIVRQYVVQIAAGLWFVDDVVQKTVTVAELNFHAQSVLPFSIVGNIASGVITLNWGAWAASVSGVYQAGADVTKPTTLKLTATNVSGTNGDYLAFTRLKWTRS